MEVTAFHVRLAAYSSLWPYSSPHGVRPLAVILLFAARTFLSSLTRAATVWPAFRYFNTANKSAFELCLSQSVDTHVRPANKFPFLILII